MYHAATLQPVGNRQRAFFLPERNMDHQTLLIIVCAICVGAVLGVLAVGLVQRERGKA